MKSALALCIALLAGCSGGPPRRAQPPPPAATRRTTPSRVDPFEDPSFTGMLHKSGDPQRPNIVIEAEVRRLTEEETFNLRAKVEGRVSGNLFTLTARAFNHSGGRVALSRNRLFIVVQSGGAGFLQVGSQWEGSDLEVRPLLLDGGIALEMRTRVDDLEAQTTVTIPNGDLIIVAARQQRIDEERLGALSYEPLRRSSAEIILLRATIIN